MSEAKSLSERLRAAVALESAAIAPQVTALMVLAREAADRIDALEAENERLRSALAGSGQPDSAELKSPHDREAD